MLRLSSPSSHWNIGRVLVLDLLTGLTGIQSGVKPIKPHYTASTSTSLTFRVRGKFLLNLTGSCPNSTDVDRHAFALHAPSTYSIVYVRVRCHSNETRAPIANANNSAQWCGIPHQFPKVTPGSVQQCRNAARDRQTHRRAWPQYISLGYA